jgi:hypothetical protein
MNQSQKQLLQRLHNSCSNVDREFSALCDDSMFTPFDADTLRVLNDPFTFPEKSAAAGPDMGKAVEHAGLLEEFCGYSSEQAAEEAFGCAAGVDQNFFAKAANKLQRRAKVTGNISESMSEMYQTFAEFFSPEQAALVRKAIKALDVTGFLKLLSLAMSKSAVAA